MSLSNLLDHLTKTAALSQISGLISWDQETVMPPKGASQRAEQSGAIASVIHTHQSDPRIPQWISEIDQTTLSDMDRANVEQAKRAYDLATKIPEALAQESAKAASNGQITWAEARSKKDFTHFAPALERIVELKRQEAACLANSGENTYDVLLDQFEPGATTSTLLPLLESMREPLVSLRERIAEKEQPKPLTGTFPAEKQLALAKKVSSQFGYDFEAGRLDLSNHPFSSGSGDDCRITTRVDESDPINCLYSTIHEVGHALYSQGLSHPFLPGADYCSMGVHESQSRFWENQIARSQSFVEWLYPHMKDAFPDMSANSSSELYASINTVSTGYIRTEADEVHYNLHVLLRFQLERDLISGNLDVKDLEARWNELFEQYFGLQVDDVNNGVLQDIHWSVGLFGYFPTYSLGNIYSACLDVAMLQDMPNRNDAVSKGDTKDILMWLRNTIHEKGRLLSAPELIKTATGKDANTEPLITYLETKYGDIYNL